MAGGRTFLIRLLGDSKGAEEAFKKTGVAAGSFDKKMLAVGAAAAGVFAGIVVGITKTATALLKLGEEFDDAFDKIRIGTGATGAAFDGLQESFRNVVANVPQSFGTVAGAITDLATRTNLTGEQLDTLAERTLTLSRLLEQDVSGIIVSTTRVFNRYNLSFAEQLEFLDLLLRANQATGASVDGLATQLLNAKPALDRLGFSLEEQVALLASFEREGVPAERVVAAITRGVANFAKEGQPAADALRAVFDEIRNAPSADDADALGVRIFGARGFAPVVDAIRDGALEIDDILRQLSEGDTIMGLAEETDGLREKWAEFKNYLKLQFEPAATEVFAAAEGLIAELTPAVDRVVAAFKEDGLEGALEQVAIEWDKIYNDPDIGIKALWERFLVFMEEYVLPEVIDLGLLLGKAIFDGLVQGFNDAVKRIAFRAVGMRYLGEQPAATLIPKPIVPDGTRAMGGPVSAGSRYLVGEQGPELFIPNVSGTIVPNGAFSGGDVPMLGGGGITINVSGAIDPEGTARTILRVLQDAERRSGARL